MDDNAPANQTSRSFISWADWSKELRDASEPRPRIKEMVEALDKIGAQKASSLRAQSVAFNGGVLDHDAMRIVATLEACKGLLDRIYANVVDWPAYVQLAIKGERPPKQPDAQTWRGGPHE